MAFPSPPKDNTWMTPPQHHTLVPPLQHVLEEKASTADPAFDPFQSDFGRMKRFKSRINVNSDEFAANYDSMIKLVDKLNAKLEDWQFQGVERRVKQHTKRNKLLARERLELVLDQDSPFLEIMPLLGQGWEDVDRGNPMVGGIGIISGIECMVVANSPTVGRGMNPATGRKFVRFFEISLENRLPFIQLLESPGADLPKQFQTFHGRPMAFYCLAQLMKQRIRTVSVVFGTCIAGGAYFAGMTDYTIMVKDNSRLALGGSKLTQMATGEVSTEEEIGGSHMHSTVSGSSEYLVANEYEAIKKARELIATFDVRKATIYPNSLLPESQIREPYYNPDELLGIVNGKTGHPNFDMKEVIARIVDASEFFEYKPLWGSTMVCAWAKIYGVPVGILGNNGVIFPSSASKGTTFINLCNQKGIPILYFHNVTGFIVGKKSEREGMLKWGAQMIAAMSNVDVPSISIIVGSSFGAANYAMCGVGYRPRFIFSWPSAECAVMGPGQLAGVLELLAREKAKKRGKKADEEKLAMATNYMRNKIRKEMESFYYSPYGVDDGLIDPRDTRVILGIVLSAVCNRAINRGYVRGHTRL